MNWAIVSNDGTVTRAVVIDGDAHPATVCAALPAGHYWVQSDIACPGMVHHNGEFLLPFVPITVPGGEAAPEGAEYGYEMGAVRFWNGRAIRSMVPNNVNLPFIDGTETTWAPLDGTPVTPAGWQYPVDWELHVDGQWYRNATPTNFLPSEWPPGWVQIDGPGGDPVAPVEPPAAAWAPNVTYGVGQEAEYAGIVYVIVTPHTSQVGWEPPNVPALWAPKEVT